MSGGPGARVLFEMAAWSVALPVLKRVLSLPRLVALMWTGPREHVSESRQRAIVRVSQSLARVRPRGDNCLERSLLAYRFLARGGADPRLVLGVKSVGDAILGHAWVTVDEVPVHDRQEDLTEFAPLVVFGAYGLSEASSAALSADSLPSVWR